MTKAYGYRCECGNEKSYRAVACKRCAAMEAERYAPPPVPRLLTLSDRDFCDAVDRGFRRASWLHFWWSLGQVVSGKVRHVRS